MVEAVCTPWQSPADGYRTEYSVYGRLDVDSLLAKARPKGDVSIWRRGEATEFGVASSSGITVPVSDGVSKEQLFRDVRRFLKRERIFLLAISRLRGPVQRGLVTSISARPGDIPVGFELPATLLAYAGRRRVSWAFMSYPSSWDAVQQRDEADKAADG
jgi:hypothetical protein